MTNEGGTPDWRDTIKEGQVFNARETPDEREKDRKELEAREKRSKEIEAELNELDPKRQKKLEKQRKIERK